MTKLAGRGHTRFFFCNRRELTAGVTYMEKVWGITVKVTQGLQWFEAAITDKAEAETAVKAHCSDNVEFLDVRQIQNHENLKDGEIRQMPYALRPGI